MSKIKWSSVVMALVYIALGLLFIVRPINVEGALCYVLAIAVAMFGLLYLVGYFIASAQSEEGSNGFAIGILMIMLAIFIVAKKELIITLVPFLFGVMVMIRGLLTLQTAFRVKRLGFPMRVPLLIGLLIMAFGLFIMLFPLESGETLFILIGCGLLAAGISGLAEEIVVRSMHRKDEHARERARDMGPAIKTYEEEEAEAVTVDYREVDKLEAGEMQDEGSTSGDDKMPEPADKPSEVAEPAAAATEAVEPIEKDK